MLSKDRNQAFVAWDGQGTIADRTREHLATSDRGISMRKNQRTRNSYMFQAGQPESVAAMPRRNA